jgi:hypothetical protein
MSNGKTICIEAWDVVFDNNFDLGGKITIEVQGATKDGKGQQHVIKLRVCEYALARFAEELRTHFLRLQRNRAEQSQENLKVFNQVTE